jgi:hypothetical protein
MLLAPADVPTHSTYPCAAATVLHWTLVVGLTFVAPFTGEVIVATGAVVKVVSTERQTPPTAVHKRT